MYSLSGGDPTSGCVTPQNLQNMHLVRWDDDESVISLLDSIYRLCVKGHESNSDKFIQDLKNQNLDLRNQVMVSEKISHAARQFIIERGLREEFNDYCREKNI